MRLWRVRRRHSHIDAELQSVGDSWQLTYLRNDRELLQRRFETEALARADADERLRELLRAGWVSHW